MNKKQISALLTSINDCPLILRAFLKFIKIVIKSYVGVTIAGRERFLFYI